MIALILLALAAQSTPRPKPKPAPVAAKPASPAAAKSALPASPWSLRENEDSAAGARFASASINGPAGYRLAVRCDLSPDPVISVQFIPPKGFSQQTEKLVTVLPDNGAALVVNWEFVGSGAINRTAEVFHIVQLFAAAKQLRIFTTDAAGDPVSDSFEGPGGDAIFRHVFEVCSTPYEPMTPMATASTEPVAAQPAVPVLKLSPTTKTQSFKLPPASTPPAAPPEEKPK
jgi:hypothetical protein